MHDFPHRYLVAASAASASDVSLAAANVPILRSDSPVEFGGPGDRWSPETLLVGSLADCFVLTFRGVAQASKLRWTDLRCVATGTLDRIDRVTQFTAFHLQAELTVPGGADRALVERVLQKAERGCLIANSLKAPVALTTQIRSAVEALAAQECA